MKKIETAGDPLAELLDQDCADYRAMYQLGLEQQRCIAREDLQGLELSFERMHRLMDRIRLRQEGRLAPEAPHPEVELRRAELRRLIGQLQELRRTNEAAVRQLMERTREELRQFQQSRRALRGYQLNQVHEARFFDGTR